MADEFDEFEDAPEQPQAAPVAQGRDEFAEFADAPPRAQARPQVPPQVARVQQAAAARPRPPTKPVDPRKKSELLGAAEGSTGIIDKFWNRIDQVPLLGNALNDPTQQFGPLANIQRARVGARMLHDFAAPRIAEAEKTMQPGGIGKFIGEQVPLMFAGGPVVSGGVQGFTESDAAPGDWLGVAKDTAIGAGLGKLGDFATKPIAKFAGDQVVKRLAKFNPDKVIPALRNAKNDAYDAVRKSGIAYTPEAVERLHQSMLKTVNDFTTAPDAHGTAMAKIRQLGDKVAGTPVSSVGPHGPRPNTTPLPATLGELDKLRAEIFNDVVDVGSREQKELGRRLAKQIDHFIDTGTPNDIITPNGQGMAYDAHRLMDAARTANKKYRNVELVDRKLTAAERKTKRYYSGGNVDNKIRQTFGPLSDEGSRANIERFLHPEAFQQLRKVSEGTGFSNAARAVGRFQPFGLKGAVVAKMTGGASVPVSLIAKHVADKATRKNVADLMEMIASGGGREQMLAERQLRAVAKRNSGVGQFLTALEKDVAELTGRAAATVGGEHMRSESRTLDAAKARAQR